MTMSVVSRHGGPSLATHPAAGGYSRGRRLQPGWPLAAYFVGYPLWWLLGVTQLACITCAAVMALELGRRRRVVVPRGFGVWLLFLLWTVSGPFVAQVVAPGTTGGIALNHYAGWAYRVIMLGTGTVALVYVTTLELSARRVGRILSCMFLTIVAGGLLGVLAPHLSFPSLAELALPRHLDANPFIHSEVHPTPAEVQNYVGNVSLRPSAPFGYSNEWGLNFALFLPFFVRTWFAEDAGWRRVVAPLVLLVALVPVVYSLNRGLWAALLLSAVFLAVRAAIQGHVRLLATLVAVAVVVTMVILNSPLKDQLASRFSGHNSNQGRTNLQTFAVTDTWTTSPVVGFGSTRRLQGSFHSIAEGGTQQCRLCTPPAVGTQGRIWTVVFLFGFGGALLFLFFFVLTFLRHLRERTPSATMCLTVMLVSLVTMPIYDFSWPAGIAVMCAIALLARESPRSLVVPLGRYRSFVAENRSRLVGGAVLGALVGGLVAMAAAPRYQATAALALPPSSPALTGIAQPPSLDDVAQLVQGNLLTADVARALGASESEVAKSLTVGAVPNSRILLLTYRAPTREAAVLGAEATSRALLAERRASLGAQRARLVEGLNLRTKRIAEVLRIIAERGGPVLVPVPSTDVAADDDPVTLLPRLQEQKARAVGAPVDPGTVAGPVTVRHDIDRWLVDLSGGALVGFLLAVLALRSREPRVGRVPGSRTLRGTPVIVTFDQVDVLRGVLEPRLLAPVGRVADRKHGIVFIAADDRAACTRLSRLLCEAYAGSALAAPAWNGPGEPRLSVVVVVSTRSHRGAVTQALERLRPPGVDVAGVVLVHERHPLVPPVLLRPVLFRREVARAGGPPPRTDEKTEEKVAT